MFKTIAVIFGDWHRWVLDNNRDQNLESAISEFYLVYLCFKTILIAKPFL